MKASWIINIIFCGILSVSCSKEGDYIRPSSYSNTPEGNFRAFWEGIDQNYLFFKYDNVDWDQMYRDYKPRVTSNTTKSELYGIFVEMLEPLIDGHRELYASGTDTFSIFNSNYLRKHPIFYPLFKHRVNYMDSIYSIKGFQPGDQSSQQVEILFCKIKNENIGYMKINFFGNNLDDQQNILKLDRFLTLLNNSNPAGLIIDVRFNGGGYANEFYKVISRFVNKEYIWGYSQNRLGRGRDNLSPLVPEKVKPNSVTYTHPIVILADRYSFSASELTCLALKELPYVTIMGDSTGGANGPVSDVNDYTGNFYLPNGWKMQLAQRTTLDANKQIFEGKGVPPDVVIRQNRTDFDNGKDLVLEGAIAFLKK